jgi:hypothetical protein
MRQASIKRQPFNTIHQPYGHPVARAYTLRGKPDSRFPAHKVEFAVCDLAVAIDKGDITGMLGNMVGQQFRHA